MFEVYEETPVFILMDITEDVVESVVHKLLGGSGLSGMDSEALQVWLLKFGYHGKTNFVAVEYFVD